MIREMKEFRDKGKAVKKQQYNKKAESYSSPHTTPKEYIYIAVYLWVLLQDLLEKGVATHSSILARRLMDWGAWQVTVHGVPKSWTRLKRLSTHRNYGSPPRWRIATTYWDPRQVGTRKLRIKIPRALPCYLTTNQSGESNTRYSPIPKFYL